MLASNDLAQIRECHPIFSCEGTGEEVIVRKLIEGDALIFPKDNVVEVTRKRRASDIQDAYLKFEYDWPVCIVRVLDSLRERFRLGQLYARRFPVISVYTRPEIEMLIIVREGKFSEYAKRKSSMKPSAYCREAMRFPNVKSGEFLRSYWDDAGKIVAAAVEYRRLAHLERGELCLADIVAQ